MRSVSTAHLGADYLADNDFTTLAESAPDLIARFDRDLRVLYINRSIEEITGTAPAAVMGNLIDELPFPPEVLNIFRKRCLRVFETAETSNVDLIIPTLAGARHFQTRIVPAKDEQGETVTVLTISRDHTERVQWEERQRFIAQFSARLNESPDYGATLQNLAQMMLEILADGCAIDVPAGEQAGPRLAVASKQANIDIPHGHDLGLQQRCIRLPLQARGKTLCVLTLVLSESRPAYDAQDLAFAEELAARAALIVDNARLYQEAVSASITHAEFLSTLSHELRTPLNAILGYTELMGLGVAGPINEQQRQQLGRIRASAWHLLSVVQTPESVQDAAKGLDAAKHPFLYRDHAAHERVRGQAN